MIVKYSMMVATCMVLLSAGCSIGPQIEPISAYNQITNAKIKVFQQNGNRSIYLYPNQMPAKLIELSVFGYLIETKEAYKNKLSNVIQIPYFRPYAAKAQMTDYIVRAGKPLTIVGVFLGRYEAGVDMIGCRERFATFIPEPGHSYETYLTVDGYNYDKCTYIQVMDLKEDAGVVKEVPVKDVTRIGMPEAIREYENKSK